MQEVFENMLKDVISAVDDAGTHVTCIENIPNVCPSCGSKDIMVESFVVTRSNKSYATETVKCNSCKIDWINYYDYVNTLVYHE